MKTWTTPSKTISRWRKWNNSLSCHKLVLSAAININQKSAADGIILFWILFVSRKVIEKRMKDIKSERRGTTLLLRCEGDREGIHLCEHYDDSFTFDRGTSISFLVDDRPLILHQIFVS